MSEILVCQNATCECDAGVSTVALTVTSQAIVNINGQLVATQADCAYPANLAGFGVCNILTDAAEGTPTTCSPVFVGTWLECSTKVSLNGSPALLEGSTLACAVGGSISIVDPNNTKVDSAS